MDLCLRTGVCLVVCVCECDSDDDLKFHVKEAKTYQEDETVKWADS